uniref:hypothetical protein n=1 Tax=Aquisphaera insulae TaxID=2712864 RepID=UPI0013ED5416
MTEPISITALALHLPLGLEGLLGLSPAAVQAGPRLGAMPAADATRAQAAANAIESRHSGAFLDLPIVPKTQPASTAKSASATSSVKAPAPGDWLGLAPLSGN